MTFTGEHSVSFSQGRRGEVYVYQGYGNRGMVWSPSLKQWRQVGMDSPTAAPAIAVNSTPTYYIPRIDIEDDGDGYNKPPLIVVDPPPAGGTQAKAISRIRAGRISEIEVTEQGKGYTKTPCVKVIGDNSCGTGLALTFELEDGSAPGESATGIVYWEISVFGEKYPCWPAGSTSGTGNDFACTLNATGGSGTGAKVRISHPGDTSPQATGCGVPQTVDGEQAQPTAPSIYFVEVDSFGSGYKSTDEVTVTVPFAKVGTWSGNSFSPTCSDAGCAMVIKGYPLGHPKCPSIEIVNGSNPYRARKIKQVAIPNRGTGYLSAPTIAVCLAPGQPATTALPLDTSVDCEGQVSKVEVQTADTFLIPPVYERTNSGGGKALAIVRATLRGKYQCYYRFVDNSIPESEGGPRYSNLSPVLEVDCGDGASVLTWTVPGSGAYSVELWRTSSNQATTLYRVKSFAAGMATSGFADSLTDNELTNADRDGFSAMPILLPNGELNANRFGVPPDNFAVGVMFQDRMWMGVDTSGKEPNTLRFSEADEPEAMADVNELIIQSNLRATDYLTALIPYAGALICCQARHSHRLTYVGQPLIDAATFLLAYRGCVNQRCWDIYEGKVFAMDDQGVYSLDPQGNVESLSVGLDDLWREGIDFSLREWFFVRADRRMNVLRVNVAVKGDGSTKYPTRQLVYSFDYKTWWEERYPVELTSATDCRTSEGQMALVYGTSQGNYYQLSAGLTDVADGSISAVAITNRGRGYRIPPKITASGGHGAIFEAGINPDGEVTGIIIKQPGTQYASGTLTIEPPPQGGVQATATYTATSGSRPVYWTFKSGNFEFTSDTQDRKAGEGQNRQVSVVYQPTKSKCELHLKSFYNGAKYPRSNVVRRDRGTGFIHSDEIPAATLDMQRTPLQEAESHGVARALFSGRTLDDMMGADRHVAIELSGQQDEAGPIAIHSVDIAGVNEQPGA